MGDRSVSLIAEARATRNSRSGVEELARSASGEELVAAMDAALAANEPAVAASLGVALVAAGHRIPRDVALRLFAKADLSKSLLALTRYVDADSAEFALEVIKDGRFSSEREALFLLVACETMSGAPTGEFVSAMRLFGRDYLSEGAALFYGLAARKLDHPEVNTVARLWIAQAVYEGEPADLKRILFGPILDNLDEIAEARVIGDGYHTVVRSDAKIGRNDPCPCGSGKKYKRCCSGKDADTPQEIDRVAEFNSAAGRPALQFQILQLLRGHELARLDPARLNPTQIKIATRKLLAHKSFDDVERFAAAFEHAGMTPHEASDWREDVVQAALDAGALDTAERILATIEDPEVRASYAWKFTLRRKSPEAFAQLETHAAAALGDDDPEKLIDLAFTLLEHSPALGILAARAAIRPDRYLDSYTLLEIMGEARDRLGIPPEEPWWEFFEVLVDSDDDDADDEGRTDSQREDPAAARLREQLAAANAKASRLSRELAARQQELAAVAPAPPAPDADVNRAKLEQLEEERRRLRAKVESMKGEISEGVQQRAELRRQLALVADERARTEPALPRMPDTADDDADGEVVTSRPHAMLVPLFTSDAGHAVRTLPERVGEAAVKTAARLAVGDEPAWSEVKRMKSAREILTCRLGRSYRMLFRLTSEHVEVLQVIHRRDLDAALQKIRRG